MITMIGLLFIGCTSTQSISGTVLDIWNKPIAGAMIQMKGSSVNQTSGSNGEFSFELPQDVDGPLTFRAGHESFIHDVEIVNYNAESPEENTLSFSLYPRPSSKGFFAIQSTGLEALNGETTTLISTSLEAHQGIKNIGSVALGKDKQSFLFHSSLRKEEIQQLNLALNALTFHAKEEVKGIMGETPVELDLWKATGAAIEFTLRSLDQEQMFLLEFPQPLNAGVYAFHGEGVLDAEKEGISLPKELKKAYPFEVK